MNVKDVPEISQLSMPEKNNIFAVNGYLWMGR